MIINPFKVAPVRTTLFDLTPDVSRASESTLNARVTTPALVVSGTGLIVTLASPPSGLEGWACDAIYAGHAANTDPDFESGFVQLLSGGLGSFTVPTTGNLVLDIANFNPQAGKQLLIAYHVTSGTLDTLGGRATQTGWVTYNAGYGASSAATQNISAAGAYSPTTNALGIKKIETFVDA